MKKTIFSKALLFSAFLMPFTIQAKWIDNPGERNLLSMDLMALASVQVYTASREWTPIHEAPSVVTVITDEDIRRRGYHNLKEVLDQVPGFFNSPDESLPLIANRGYTQNPSNNYLLLIDGHAINSVADEGIGINHMLPFLHQVKRIEVIRGPGSTLWGGDAANGIIHLITYNGKDLAQPGELFSQVTLDYEFSRPRHIINSLFGMRLGDEGDLMLSLTQTENEAEFLPLMKRGSSDLEPHPRRRYKHEAQRPSYEVHMKSSWRDFRLALRSAREAGFYRNQQIDGIDIPRDNDGKDFNFDFMELSYSPLITDDLSLETDIYRNWSEVSWRNYDANNTLDNGWDSTYTETGLNTILSYSGITDHRVKGGIQWRRRVFDGQYFVTPGNERFETLTGTENAVGVFVENQYAGIEDWLFTLGARYEDNDFRQAGSDLLYRGAAIWQFNDHWTFKYLYNSGIVPATLTRSRGSLDNPLIVTDPSYASGTVAELGPENPQLSYSHDLQASYRNDNTEASITLFKQDIEGYIARVISFNTGETLSDGTPIWIRETNLGDLEAIGIELDGRYQLNHSMQVYGNYAWAVNKAKSRTGNISSLPGSEFDLAINTSYFNEDSQMTGVPEHIWNLGLDWSFSSKHRMNLHYRGWTGNWGKITNEPDFKVYGPEHYVDLNLLCSNCYAQGFEFQGYIKNIFDNRSLLPSSAHGGNSEGLGREIGASVVYRF
ncbi:TonB-dependent receptor plug domain-containing protein [Amphritea balenae]|uniref:TonB-dependent receptor n=1 Tax=Amphritea balenae TaxID=452629 RepID=A0A3P1SMY5_9GAMM|nr:TonB-dependent receptor [Amphritea balenae]RRC97612.1 hypothetical protein EHS89_17410 [Amphritea balenae]GGK73682.1 hypothetical protein GCM10007941_24690 [Amphritea balenae]